MAIDDPTDLTTLDWLGRSQPLARKSLELTSSGGGGGVTAPVTPSAMERARDLVGEASGSPSVASASASDFDRALQAAGLGQRALGVIRRFQQPTPVPGAGADLTGRTFGGEPVTPEQALAIRGAGGILGGAGQLPGQVPIGAIGTGVEAPAESAVEASSVAGSQTAAASGEAAQEAAGVSGGEAAGDLAALAGIITTDLSDRPDEQKAVLSALYAAAPFTFGVSALAATVLPLIASTGIEKDVDPIFGRAIDAIFGSGGDYIPKRIAAGKEATADISGLGSSYQAAAASGDLGHVLTALQTPRGPVHSVVYLPAEMATQMGLTPGTRRGDQVGIGWTQLNPAQFSQVLDYFRQNPEALASAIEGSGDVPYLPAGQAEQVGAAAANDARALLSFVLSQTAPPQAAPTPPTPEPVPPSPLVPSGPAGALGFARELLGTT